MVGAAGSERETILHASAVAVDGRGLLISGASGSGKSTLAIEMIALGADLVADDRVVVRAMPEGGVVLSAPAAISGTIEARGLGLLASRAAPARGVGWVDLDTMETARLPEYRTRHLLGVDLPLIGRVESRAFPSMLMLWLRGERTAP